MHPDEVHKVAAEFLESLQRGTAYREERLEPLSISMPMIHANLVALKRDESPQYFCGFKPSGRPIFAYDLRVAKSFESKSQSMADDVDHLRIIGVKVFPHPTVWHEGRHRSEF